MCAGQRLFQKNKHYFHKMSEVVTTFITFGGDVLLGSAIFVIGFLLANVAYHAIDRTSGENSKSQARYAILALVVAMGLGAMAVAVALSFGLGGREAAGKLMSHWLSQRHKDSGRCARGAC